MATVLLAMAGQALGTSIGGTVLGVSMAAIGQAAGAMVGQMVDARLTGGMAPSKNEGPRLDSLDVMTSQEGADLATLDGRAAIAGEIIWAAKLREVARDETTRAGSGKRSQKVTTTYYDYFASFAVSLGQGPFAHMGRVWADGALVDLSGLINDGRVRFYSGTETQLPDPHIAAVEGDAPAYRGTAYVVFEDLPLADFGNRIPQIKVECWGQSGVMETLLRGVNIIPGSTEWGYMPTVVRTEQRTAAGEVISDKAENGNRFSGVSDWSVSMSMLDAVLPAVDTASLVVSWFGSDLRAGSCRIEPRCEEPNKTTTPAWVAAGLTRATAKPVSRINDRPAYGSAPADASVVAAIRDLRARGKRVVLYPFLMLDVPPDNTLPDPSGVGTQAAYPWRGRICPAAGQDVAAQVAAFMGAATPAHFTVADGAASYAGPEDWGFRRFILHLAHLAKAAGGVDAFLIGSEMVGMTTARTPAGVYPFVAALQALAADVRAVLPGAKISYAADWSEYHSHRNGAEVIFHLDPLWSDPNVDFVGIDNYLPLSDWRRGRAHRDFNPDLGHVSGYDLAYLKSQIEGGEYWDYYYADEAARIAQDRTPIVDGAYSEPWVFRQKAIRDWWSRPHYNRPGGLRDSLLPGGNTPASTFTTSDSGGSGAASGLTWGGYTAGLRVIGSGNVAAGRRSAGITMEGGRWYRVQAYLVAGTSAMARLRVSMGGDYTIVTLTFATGRPAAYAANGMATRAIAAAEVSPGVWRLSFEAQPEDTAAGYLVVGPHSRNAGEDVHILAAEVFDDVTSSTPWVPASKPVWFTELGCPAVDFGATRPNVFWAEHSSESNLPWGSEGLRDDFMQRQFLRASLEWWRDNGGAMLDVGNVQVWSWDARPWPEFPKATALWADGGDWRLGHWLNGRAGAAPAAEAIARRLTAAHGLTPQDYDVSRAYGQADGYPAPGPLGFREWLSPLEVGLGLQSHEAGGKVVVESRGALVVVPPVSESDMVDGAGGAPVTATRGAIEDVAAEAVVSYRDGGRDYITAAARATVGAAGPAGVAQATSPLTLDLDLAQSAAERLLRTAADGRERVVFAVPRSFTALRPGVVAPVAYGGRPARLMVVDRVTEGIARQVEARAWSDASWRLAAPVQAAGMALPVQGAAGVLLRFVDLPLLPGSEADPWDTLLAAHALPWPGQVVAAQSANAAAGFGPAVALPQPARIGATAADLAPGRPHTWTAGPLALRLYSGSLVGRSPADVLEGANALAIRHADGWEVVQFRDADLDPDAGQAGRYILTGLLRGQRGTEHLAARPLPAGADVVVLTGALVPLGLTQAQAEAPRWVRFGPAAAAVTDHATRQCVPGRIGERPFAPAHLTARPVAGATALSWVRRTRLAVPTWPASGQEPAEAEAAERYRVEIGPAGAPVRVVEVATPAFAYTAAMRSADGLAAPFQVAVAQVSAAFGPGVPTTIIVTE